MCNTNSCPTVGCCLLSNFSNALGNLFSVAPYCGCNNTGNNTGCGCNNNNVNNINNGCGCNNNGTNNGCGCNNIGTNNSCGQCYDAYYARQYALYPFNTAGGCPCGNG